MPAVSVDNFAVQCVLIGFFVCDWASFNMYLFFQNQDLYRSELRKSDTVVSCVGGFGKTDAYMELVNGEANIKLAEVRLGVTVCVSRICVERVLTSIDGCISLICGSIEALFNR